MSDIENLRHFLKDWADWQAGYRQNIGFASRVPLLATGGGGYTTFDELMEGTDNATMSAIDGSIDGLQPSQRAAVHRAYGICAVWRFPRDNYQEMLDAAHAALLVSLWRKGVL